MTEESNGEMKLGLEHKPLIMNEIIQARELVKELQTTLDPTSSTSRKLLISKILSSFETSLSMIDRIDKDNDQNSPTESPDAVKKLATWTQSRRYTFASRQGSKEGRTMDNSLGGNMDGKTFLVLSYLGFLAMKQVKQYELDSFTFAVRTDLFAMLLLHIGASPPRPDGIPDTKVCATW
ncbi:hypothetical protein C5167_047653 [Papaver somniferum]|uniref:Uncharacterized protein n=1 Tax=Papaver somniferum TaxID=3469 RepID=A0A4Y7LIU0_PAPSO|nr:hypothetical protein C5167_047653 [Papaver somniferum]